MQEEEHRDAGTDQPDQTHADEDPVGAHETQQKDHEKPRGQRLTAVMAKTLWAIEPTAAPSMRRLAADLGCDPSTVTFLADRLQEKELITREIDPENRRAKIVRLTERGREVRRLIGTAMLTRSSIAHLGAAEQRQLCRLLTKAARAKSTGAATITGTD
ncbi:MarR family winged helix-turn-helix transcriptional regulator [Nocardia brasiliensis]|uniref:MarR family winged helix-turn-helix transcriptional regulator n=1 Tax=Nocardia brasiliensis TaxID=37326 RepID=UPI0037BAF98A